VVLALLLGLAGPARAQDLIQLWGDYQPPTDVELVGADTDLRASLTTWGGAVLTPPIRLAGDDLLWINGASFMRIAPDLTGPLEPRFGDPSETVTSINLRSGVVARLGERWTTSVLLIPGLHSNFVGRVGLQAIRMQAIGLVSYDLSDRTTLGGGFGYVNLFGVPSPIVAVQAIVDGERWRLDALLPQYANVWVEPVDDVLSVGARGTVTGGFYHRGIDQPGAPDDLFLEYSVGALGPAVEVRVGPLRLMGELGRTFFRRFEVVQGRTPVTEFELEPGWHARGTVALTPPARG